MSARSTVGRRLRVSLWHPFTARSIGWAEPDLARVHSRPHVLALLALAEERGARCRVEYLTDARRPHATGGDLPRRFWPRSARWRRASDAFRREWSTLALLAAAVAPADVTIINMSGHGSTFTRALGRTLRRRGRATVAMLGGFHATLDGAQLAFLARASVVATHNHDLRARIVAAGIPAERVVVVPLGVDEDRFRPDGADRSPTPPTVLFVGRFEEWKGLHHLVAAAPTFLAACPEARLRLVGPGSGSAYGAQLRAQADAAGVGRRVALEHRQPYDQLPALYRQASVFVLPSSAEGFGMVVLEAMACGVPVVALDGPGGPADIITDGVDGRLVAVDQLGTAIAELLGDPERSAAMGRAARATVEARSTAVHTARAFADLVDQALDPVRGGRR